jgi:hypothetical protein
MEGDRHAARNPYPARVDPCRPLRPMRSGSEGPRRTAVRWRTAVLRAPRPGARRQAPRTRRERPDRQLSGAGPTTPATHPPIRERRGGDHTVPAPFAVFTPPPRSRPPTRRVCRPHPASLPPPPGESSPRVQRVRLAAHGSVPPPSRPGRRPAGSAGLPARTADLPRAVGRLARRGRQTRRVGAANSPGGGRRLAGWGPQTRRVGAANSPGGGGRLARCCGPDSRATSPTRGGGGVSASCGGRRCAPPAAPCWPSPWAGRRTGCAARCGSSRAACSCGGGAGRRGC